MDDETKESKRVLVINERYSPYNGEPTYYDCFKHLGEFEHSPAVLKNAPEKIACVVFTGGADINPKLYGHERAPATQMSEWRDAFEVEAFKTAVSQKIPIFGICRGAQLMCAMAGGVLCQDLSGHEYSEHLISTHDGQLLFVNSYHHQMMMPPADAEVLAWSSQRRSQFYRGSAGEYIYPDKEIEAVYFPKVNGLGVQFHPEMHYYTDEAWDFYQKLIDRFMLLQTLKPRNGRTPSMLAAAG